MTRPERQAGGWEAGRKPAPLSAPAERASNGGDGPNGERGESGGRINALYKKGGADGRGKTGKGKRRGRGHNAKGRSTTGGQFVMLELYMLESPAWRSLSPAGRAAYIVAVSLYNGGNNGALALSVRQAAAEVGVARNTAARALRELTEKGFLKIRTPGGFSRKTRHAAEYELTAFPLRDGLPASKDFMRWRT